MGCPKLTKWGRTQTDDQRKAITIDYMTLFTIGSRFNRDTENRGHTASGNSLLNIISKAAVATCKDRSVMLEMESLNVGSQHCNVLVRSRSWGGGIGTCEKMCGTGMKKLMVANRVSFLDPKFRKTKTSIMIRVD